MHRNHAECKLNSEPLNTDSRHESSDCLWHLSWRGTRCRCFGNTSVLFFLPFLRYLFYYSVNTVQFREVASPYESSGPLRSDPHWAGEHKRKQLSGLKSSFYRIKTILPVNCPVCASDPRDAVRPPRSNTPRTGNRSQPRRAEGTQTSLPPPPIIESLVLEQGGGAEPKEAYGSAWRLSVLLPDALTQVTSSNTNSKHTHTHTHERDIKPKETCEECCLRFV